MSALPEKEYRALVDQAFKTIERAFDNIDPDLAEFEHAQGSVTILFADGTKVILSTQPSVRQVWLAAAARGVAFHFDYDPQNTCWRDDKGKGVELLAYVKTLVRESAGVELKL